MKKLLTIIFLVTVTQVKGQGPDWVWARSAQNGISSSAAGEGTTVATDLNGNVFLGGFFIDTLIIDTCIFSYRYGVFLAKYDSSGSLLWAKCGADIGNNQGVLTNIATDGFGNSYITGWFSGSIVFDLDTLTSTGLSDIFVVKYDLFGNVSWAVSAGGAGYDNAVSIAVDDWNNVYVTGAFTAQFIFNSDTLNVTGVFNNLFLLKYDSSGNPLWGRSAQHNCGESRGCSVCSDKAGNIYLTGIYSTHACVLAFDSILLANAGSDDLFLAKFDSSGNVVWAKGIGGTSYDDAFFVAADSLGYIYITGDYLSDSISFDSHTFLNPSGNANGFLTKYDSSGNVIWARSINNSNITGRCIATNGNDRVYLTGGSYNTTDSTVTFDTLTLYYPTGAVDPMFIAGYDSSGKILFGKTLSSGADDQNAVAVSPSGSVYVGGDFFQVNPFVVGNDSLFLIGGENVFLAKLGYIPFSTEGISENATQCEYTFSLYPNPFTNKLNIITKETEPTQIILYDILSRKLLEEKFTSSAILNTEPLAKGIYIYEVRNKNGEIKNGKVVKE